MRAAVFLPMIVKADGNPYGDLVAVARNNRVGLDGQLLGLVESRHRYRRPLDTGDNMGKGTPTETLGPATLLATALHTDQ